MGGPPFNRLLCTLCILGWGLLSLSGVEVEPDRRKLDPLLQIGDVPAVEAAQRRAFGQAVRPETPVPVFLRVSGQDDALPDAVRSLGGTARRVHPRIVAARIPMDAARYLSNRPQVLYIEAERIARPLLDVSRPAVSADFVQLGTPPLPRPIRGASAFVGIVDTGVSAAHPDFAGRANGTFSFSSTVDPLQDTDGHGTHVAGIAAGDGAASGGRFTGMAPDAQILVGRAGTVNFPLGNVFNAIDALLAAAAGNPVAINLSLGVVLGPHDGTSSFETVINDRATGPAGSRRIITVAAGNEQDRDEHFRATVSAFGAVTAPITLSGDSGAEVQLWADGNDEYTVVATMGGESVSVSAGSSGLSPGRTISVSNGTGPNGATFIDLFFTPPVQNQAASVRLERTRNGGTGQVDGYVDALDATFSAGDPFGTISEPANAEDVVAVASFNTKPNGGAGQVGAISSFSSQGPTRDGRSKPDLAAPGSLITSARSREAAFQPIEVFNDNYVIIQGTSMASPHAAGIAALVWDANPNLTGAQMRERLKSTADPQPVSSTSPNNTWGHGKVNALRAVQEAVAGITIVPPPGVSEAAIPPGTPVTLLGDEKSSGPFGQALSYSWNAAAGGVLGTPLAARTSFSASVPGNYPVTLTVTPQTAADSAATTLHVNTLPVAQISGPAASDNVGVAASFSGAPSSDPDRQPIAVYRWVLVSRPAGSAATLPATNAPIVTLVPDAAGTYVVGLRVDDGLDNSVLATQNFTAGPAALPAGGGGGGGGGCSVAGYGYGWTGDVPSAGVSFLLLLLPPGALALRRRRLPLRRR